MDRSICLALVLISLPLAVSSAKQPPAGPNSAGNPSSTVPQDASSKAKAILKARCVSCHGAERPKGGLRLDAAIDGSINGAKSGLPDASELIRRVTSKVEGEKMPPEGDRLSNEDINF
ncbi:MAG: c-type cytochrome domain-containing protein [Gemmataceae bacterium]